MRGIRSIQDYIVCIFDKTLILGSSYYKNKCNIVVQYILLFVSVLSNANLYFLPRIDVKKKRRVNRAAVEHVAIKCFIATADKYFPVIEQCACYVNLNRTGLRLCCFFVFYFYW